MVNFSKISVMALLLIFLIGPVTGSGKYYLDVGSEAPGSDFPYRISGWVERDGCSYTGVKVKMSGGGVSGSDTTDGEAYFDITVKRPSSGTVGFTLTVTVETSAGIWTLTYGSIYVDPYGHVRVILEVPEGVDMPIHPTVGPQASPNVCVSSGSGGSAPGGSLVGSIG